MKDINEFLDQLVYNDFFKWCEKNNEFEPGNICSAPIRYLEKTLLTAEEVHYNAFDENNSTWKIIPYNKNIKNEHNPYKLLNLESNENIYITKGKERPCILISKLESNWSNPDVQNQIEKMWIVAPIFSYKPRHKNLYKINDICLEIPNRFYIPSNTIPGIIEDSVVLLEHIQEVHENSLEQIKMLNSNKRMKYPFKLGDTSFLILKYQINKLLGIELNIDCIEQIKESLLVLKDTYKELEQ